MTIRENKYVIVQKIGGDNLRLCLINKEQKISVDKLKFDIADAIGSQFGMFEVEEGRLKPFIDCISTIQNLEASEAITASSIPSKKRRIDQHINASDKLLPQNDHIRKSSQEQQKINKQRSYFYRDRKAQN